MLDNRSRTEIEAQAAALAALPGYVPDWGGAGRADDPGWQLVGVFARLMEVLLERANRIPERNFLAFLDYVGVEAQPGRAAEVPVTFQLGKKVTTGGLVPAGTQVATTQTETAAAEVFETSGAFFATPAKLATAVNLVPETHGFSLIAPPVLPATPETLAALEAAPAILDGAAPELTQVPYALYLAQPKIFARNEPVDVILTILLDGPQKAIFTPDALVWSRFDTETGQWVDLGAFYLAVPDPDRVVVVLPSLSGAGETEIDGQVATWIQLRWTGAGDAPVELPTIRAISGHFQPPGLNSVTDAPHALFANAAPLDPSAPVTPFGARPAYGDAFYIGSDTAFAGDVAQVTLDMTLAGYDANALLSRFAGIVTDQEIVTRIDWQYMAGDGSWRDLPGLTGVTHTISATAGPPLGVATSGDAAATLNATALGQTLSLTIDLPADIGRGKVNGVEHGWIRGLLRSPAPYGGDLQLVEVPGTPPTLRSVGPTFVPPILESLTLTRVHRITEEPMSAIVSDSALQTTRIVPGTDAALSPFSPFAPIAERSDISGDPALYFAFQAATPGGYLSLYFDIAAPAQADTPLAERGQPEVVWEVLTGGGVWRALDAADGTAHLTGSGTLGFLWPADAAQTTLFPSLEAAPAFWLRARRAGGTHTAPPRLRQILPNTAMASNVQTVGERIIGSGTGMPGQTIQLRAARFLDAELWVAEPEVPGPADGLAEEAIDIQDGATPNAPRTVWVRWDRVATFAASGPNDRHYTLEITTGTLRFGTGTAGMIPPIAKDNLVLRGLRTGGGVTANAAAAPLTVKELKTSLPFIDAVTNVRAAAGGADAWDIADIEALGPQSLRHKGRAVSVEDYEWLIRTEFSQIARVQSLAVRAPGPDGTPVFQPGAVTMIVVPDGTEATPQPSNALLRQIEARLAALAFGAIGAEVHVIPPSYVPVGITATLRPTDPTQANRVQAQAAAALEAFLHPLTGGDTGTGWDFGRAVHLSEIYAVLQGAPGVASVTVASFDGQPAGVTTLTLAETALVASAPHTIGVV